MKIGCHVSIAGGIWNAPANAAELGCEVFQIFTRSPRGGAAPMFDRQVLDSFKEQMKEHEYKGFVVHTPYYINFGSKNKSIARSSARIVREELERASALGAQYVITHLGSYRDLGKEKGFSQLVEGLAQVMRGYKGSAELLLENAAGAGEVIGGIFEELGKAIHHSSLKRYKLGTCFDTCHAFASGYDISTSKGLEKTLKEFSQQIGLDRMKAIHANDSKFGLGEKKDRHEHIGKGKIGRGGFSLIVNHPKLKKLDLYLETEHDLVREDIKLLKQLRKN